jgi:hypothetical protein
VIGKSDINSLIGFEKQKQVMGCSDDSACLAEVGGALGVDYILVGSLGKIGALYRIDLKVVETRKARVRGRIGASVEGKEEKLVVAVQKAVRDLLVPLSSQAGALAKNQQTRDSGRERSKKDADLGAKPDRSGAESTRASRSRTRRATATSSLASGGPGPEAQVAYVSGGAGLALMLGGAVAGLSAKSAYDAEKAAAGAATSRGSRTTGRRRSPWRSSPTVST